MSADSAVERRRADYRREVFLGYVAPVISVVALLVVWEILPRLGVVDARLIPPISVVVGEIPAVVADAGFAVNALSSVQHWAAGLLGAVLIGVPLGVVMGRNRHVFDFFNPLLTFAYSAPKSALIVILVFWFGVSFTSLVGVVILGSLVSIVTAAYHGSADASRNLLWAARSLGTSRVGLLARTVLPAALPSILSGVRIAVSFSLLVLLGAEFLTRAPGIGTYLLNAMQVGLYERMWGVTVMIAAFGFLMDVLYVQIVRRAFGWLDGEV